MHRIIWLGILTLVSCKNTENHTVLPENSGAVNSISLIIDEQLWNGEIGDTIRKKLAAPADGLLQEEPIFTLNQYSPKIFDGLVRKSRNLVIISKEKETLFSHKTDLYAENQQVFYLYGKSNAEIQTLIEQKASEIIQQVKKSEMEHCRRLLEKDTVSCTKIRQKFNVKMLIAHGYKFDMQAENFVWLRREFSTGYNNLLLYEVPLQAVEKNGSITANIIALRDSVGKRYIQGIAPDTWLVTEDAYTPYLFHTKINGRETFETKGTWEMKNDFMNGPFINYAVKDPKNNRYLILEGFTYNPSKAKRDLVFELETMIKSVKFD